MEYLTVITATVVTIIVIFIVATTTFDGCKVIVLIIIIIHIVVLIGIHNKVLHRGGGGVILAAVFLGLCVVVVLLCGQCGCFPTTTPDGRFCHSVLSVHQGLFSTGGNFGIVSTTFLLGKPTTTCTTTTSTITTSSTIFSFVGEDGCHDIDIYRYGCVCCVVFLGVGETK